MPYTTNPYVVAAICGNFWQESTVNPGIWENLTVGAPGFGLGQWTDNPPVVERRTALFNWLDANGYARDSGEGQLAFLIYEDIWIPSTFTPSDYNTLGDFLAATTADIDALTREFMYHWEGINDGTFSIRRDAARDFALAFTNDDGTRNPWVSSNAYLSRADATSNALLIKDFLMGAGPGPSPGPSPEELAAIIALARKRKMQGGIFIAW